MAEYSRIETQTFSIPLGERDLVDHVAWGAAGVFAVIAWAFGWMSLLLLVLIVGAAAVNTLLAIHESRWLRRIDPRTLDAIEEFLALHPADPAAALRLLDEFFVYAGQLDLREFLDLKRRAVSDPWAAGELMRLLKIKVELMARLRENVSKKDPHLPSGVKALRQIDRIDALTRRALAEAEALAQRVRHVPPEGSPP